jgi:hypothetical protein
MSRVYTRTLISVVLLVAGGQAQSTGGQNSPLQVNSQQTQMNLGGELYEDFNQKWLNPAKWQPMYPNCWGNVLECVREVRDGKLRLLVRNFGDTKSDSDIQFSESEVYFVDPNAVTSITADMNVRFHGIGCATNDTDRTHTQVQLGGWFFNMGTGSPEDDMVVWLIIWIDTIDPIIRASVYWGRPWPGPAINVPLADYPIGTQLTGMLKWDRVNHRFIGRTKVKGHEGPGEQVVIQYSEPDVMPPATPLKALQASQHTLNCTSAKTNGQVEATFDNVIVNR